MSELSDRLRAAASGGPVADSLLSEAADRIDYLERIAGTVSQGDGDFRTVVQSLKQHG